MDPRKKEPVDCIPIAPTAPVPHQGPCVGACRRRALHPEGTSPEPRAQVLELLPGGLPASVGQKRPKQA